MPITVGELLEMPHLQLRLHTGAAGLTRTVEWTHTIDLPEPWRWVTGGELVMTNGISMPRSAAGQDEMLRKLVEHGANALAIGEQMYSPPLTRRFAAVSEELEFPVLWIAYPMPFVTISRTVAEATLLEQSQRLIRTERIYNTLQRISADKAGLETLTSALSRELGCWVTVCTRRTGEVWYSRKRPLRPEVRDAVAHGTGQLRAGVIALPCADGSRALLVDVPTHADAALVCLPDPSTQPDAVLLQHAATVCALALHQTRLTLEHRRRAGAELLGQLLDGQLPADAAVHRLAEFGLRPAEVVFVAATSDDPERLHDLHVHLWRTDALHITGRRGGVAVSVLPDHPDAVVTFAEATGGGARIGVSDPVGHPDRIRDAEREAVWAMQTAEERDRQLVRYADAKPRLGPRTPQEAQAMVDQVLRPLLRLPPAESDELVRTLRAFLEQRRSWQGTAAVLNVHRQTVLYRIRKVEQLLGRQLSDTEDLATVWLALTALRSLDAP